MLAVLGRMPMMTDSDLNPTESLAFLTAPDLTEGVPMLTALDPTDGMASLMAPDPSHPKSMAFLTPDPAAGSVEVGRLLVPGSTEDDLDLCPMASYCVLAAAGPPAKDESCPTGLAEGRHLNLCPMASYYVLAAAGPLAKDENCPTGSADLNLRPVASYHVPAVADPLAKDESCPTCSVEEPRLNLGSYALAEANLLAKGESCPSLSTPGSNEGHLNLCPMASHHLLALAGAVQKYESSPSLPTPASNKEWMETLGRASPGYRQSLTTPGCAAHLPRLLRSSTTHPGSNASVTQLSHPWLHPPYRRALHQSLVLIQEP
jgi:hypothetical protein